MAMNLGALFKIAKGATDAETLKPALRAMGFDLDMQPVDLDQAPGVLRHVAVQAGRRGASLHRLSGAMKDGGNIEAFIVLVPHEQAIAHPEQKVLVSPA